MEIKELTKRIKRLSVANAKVEATIQELGLACLSHLDHGNNGPICALYGALRRPQVKPFVEWALAYGKCQKNVDKKTRALMPLVFDKTRNTDIEGAVAKPWFDFADSKVESVVKAFDFQQEVKALLNKAAAAGYDHRKLVAVAAIADIPADKVPASVQPVATMPEAAM